LFRSNYLSFKHFFFQITVATAQAAPEGVHAPKFEVVNSTALLFTWSSPDVPNGIIVEYRIHFIGGEHHHVYNTKALSLVIAGEKMITLFLIVFKFFVMFNDV
jgi:hypothetical protein